MNNFLVKSNIKSSGVYNKLQNASLIYLSCYMKKKYNISSIQFRGQRKVQHAGFVTKANQQC